MKVTWEKSFVVYWTSSLCKENFCGFALDMFCFVQVCKISRENFRDLLKIHENRETFLPYNFHCLWYAYTYNILSAP